MTSGSLFEGMTAWLTLVRAFDRVEENRGAAGVDGVTVDEFAASLETALTRLRESLVHGTYRLQPLLRVRIPRDIGQTPRRLSIPTVRDRVAQTAAALVLTPVLEPGFSDVSFAYRRGRSVDQAVRRVIAYRNAGYRWVLDADIDDFFDEIPHDGLLGTLGRHVTDRRFLSLVEHWMAAEVQDGAERFTMKKGIAQGSPLSPLLANLYLDAFDDALVGHGRRLVRFADDFVILCKTKPGAEAALDLSEDVLGDLRLRLSPEKTRVTDFDHGFRFLGVQFLRSLAFRPVYSDEEGDDTGAAEAVSVDSDPTTTREPGDAAMDPRRVSQDAQEAAGERQEPALGAEPATPSDESAPREDTALATAMRRAVVEFRQRETDGPATGAGGEVQPTADHDPLLRSLYLLEQGIELGKEDERLVVRKAGEVLRRVPVMKVDQVLVFGNVAITTPAMRLCLKADIPVYMLSRRGRYYGVIESATSERVMLHREQFARAADQAFTLGVAREIVRGKLTNSRTVLLRSARRRAGTAVENAAAALAALLRDVDGATTLDQLRGIEGAGAARYFGVWPELVGPHWQFRGRRRRPPTDPVNSLLSFGYTVLFNNTYSLVRADGLNPHVGFYHALREGHPALVSDLIEEFRAPVVDATVLALLHRRQLKLADFQQPRAAGHGCRISRDARKRVVRALEASLSRPVSHPDAGARCDYRRAIALQVRRLTAVVKGEAPSYRAFVTR